MQIGILQQEEFYSVMRGQLKFLSIKNSSEAVEIVHYYQKGKCK